MKLLISIIFGIILLIGHGDMRILLIEAAILLVMCIKDDIGR